MDIIVLNLFDYSHVPNLAKIGVREAVVWFIKIERAKMRADGNMECYIVICVTGDGMRIGSINFHATYLRQLHSQNPHDYLPINCFIGADTKENCTTHVTPQYLELEALCKGPIEVDNESWTVKMMAPADMSEAHHLGNHGGSHQCLFCNDKLGGDQCKWRPACDHCKARHAGKVFCRHIQELDKDIPIYAFTRLIIPCKDTHVPELTAFAVLVGLTTTDVNGKKLTKAIIWAQVETWLRTYGVVLGTHTKTDPLNLVNATENMIDVMLGLRYSVPEELEAALCDDFSVERKRDLLHQCLLIEEKLTYCGSFNGLGIYDVKVLVMDIMHCRIRMGNTFFHLLLQSICNRTDLTGAEKLRRLNAINAILAEVFRSDIGTPTNIKMSWNDNVSSVELPNMNGNKLKELNLTVVDQILNVIYADADEKNNVLVLFNGQESNISYANWRVLFIQFNTIMTLLGKDENLNNASKDFDLLCDTIDAFGDLFIDMFHLGNYFHYLISGHTVDMLRRNDYNISTYQQQGCEAMNKHISLYYRHQSTHGGGNNAVDPCDDMMRCFLRRFVYKIDDVYPGFRKQCKLDYVTPEKLKNYRVTTTI